MRKLLTLLLLTFSFPAFAQSVLTIDMQQCLWHPDDDPAWAEATLDESDWRPYSEWKSTPAEGRVWVRCHLDATLLSVLPQPAIQVRLHAAYQIYFNGSLIGNSGNLSNGNFTIDGIRAYPISANLLSAPTASIALRLRFASFEMDFLVWEKKNVDLHEVRICFVRLRA
jgi:hypothetical protein